MECWMFISLEKPSHQAALRSCETVPDSK